MYVFICLLSNVKLLPFQPQLRDEMCIIKSAWGWKSLFVCVLIALQRVIKLKMCISLDFGTILIIYLDIENDFSIQDIQIYLTLKNIWTVKYVFLKYGPTCCHVSYLKYFSRTNKMNTFGKRKRINNRHIFLLFFV